MSTVKSFDQNLYATKKTVAQGMLDIALLASNASQLKYVLQVGTRHEFYTLLIVLITLSILLQMALGLAHLTLNCFRDCSLHDPRYHSSAKWINQIGTLLTFIVTILNIMTAAFVASLAKYVVYFEDSV